MAWAFMKPGGIGGMPGSDSYERRRSFTSTFSPLTVAMRRGTDAAGPRRTRPRAQLLYALARDEPERMLRKRP